MQAKPHVAVVAMERTLVYQAEASTSQHPEHHRKDREPPTSRPVRARFSAGDDSREFHLWA